MTLGVTELREQIVHTFSQERYSTLASTKDQRRFRGNKGSFLEHAVAAVLRAKGLNAKVSPPGPDGGVDIMVESWLFGYDPPQTIVEVEFRDDKVSRKQVMQLVAKVMLHPGTNGLFVGWSGFRGTSQNDVERSLASIKFWSGEYLLTQVVKYKLQDEILSLMEEYRV